MPEGVSAPVRRWPLVVIAAPAAVAVWSGWVGLGTMCGFGIVHPLPGIEDSFRINTAITLPVGVEAYGTYALRAWLAPGGSARARVFARRSAVGSLTLGMLGQVAYHLLAAAHARSAPWPIVMVVSCLPVVSLAFGAALAHLLAAPDPAADITDTGADQADEAPDTAADGPAGDGQPPPQDPIERALADMEADGAVVNGAELGRRLGVSERHGRRLLQLRADTAPESRVA